MTRFPLLVLCLVAAMMAGSCYEYSSRLRLRDPALLRIAEVRADGTQRPLLAPGEEGANSDDGMDHLFLRTWRFGSEVDIECLGCDAPTVARFRAVSSDRFLQLEGDVLDSTNGQNPESQLSGVRTLRGREILFETATANVEEVTMSRYPSVAGLLGGFAAGVLLLGLGPASFALDQPMWMLPTFLGAGVATFAGMIAWSLLSGDEQTVVLP